MRRVSAVCSAWRSIRPLPSNHFVYVYYTPLTTPPVHNRISRFTANGNVAVAGSETVILELNNLSTATNHNGGALAFGPDGKLYAAVGENANTSNAQTLNNLLGKVLRINADGTIPDDNPFYSTATGQNRAIWALGLRNPFTFAFRPGGSQFFINDVGQNSWEEINDGIAGSNYGWPTTEGATTNPSFRTPRYSYGHTTGTCAITGGAFYAPLALQFPIDYVGDYFFADYCAGWIRKLELSSNTATTFATAISFPVDLKVSDDGALYYLARGTGSSTGVVYRVEYGNQAPSITTHPSSQTVAPGASVTFSVRASGHDDASLSMAAQHRQHPRCNGAGLHDRQRRPVRQRRAIPRARDQRLRQRAQQRGDADRHRQSGADGHDRAAGKRNAVQRCQCHQLFGDGNGSRGRQPARQRVHVASRFSSRYARSPVHRADERRQQRVVHHSDHRSHRIERLVSHLHDGARCRRSHVHQPRATSLRASFRSPWRRIPQACNCASTGSPSPRPLSFNGVVGIVRTLEAVTPQGAGGTTYEFVSWSDGGAATHNISTPAAATTYTATYRVSSSGGTGTGLSATYFDNIDLSGTTRSSRRSDRRFQLGIRNAARVHRRR